MKQRIELAYEQRRKSEINRLRKINRKVMPYLERVCIWDSVRKIYTVEINIKLSQNTKAKLY